LVSCFSIIKIKGKIFLTNQDQFLAKDSNKNSTALCFSNLLRAKHGTIKRFALACMLLKSKILKAHDYHPKGYHAFKIFDFNSEAVDSNIL